MCLLIDLLLRFFYYGLFGWIILSWIEVPSTHPLGNIKILLDKFFSSILSPIRRYIPTVRLGATGIDLSPIILILGINFIRPYLYTFFC